MKNLKSTLTYLLLLIFMSAVIPAQLRVQGIVIDEFTYTLSDTEVTLTGYQGSSRKVTIPDEIKHLPVKIIGTSTFNNHTEIAEIILPDKISEIREQAFQNLPGLSILEFKGNAPQLDSKALDNLPEDLLIKYRLGREGFTSPIWQEYNALPTALTILSGSNRYETAAEISRTSHYESENVILANALDFPDALAGGPLAYKLDAPILLTKKDALSQVTASELERLKAKNIYLLGGASVISEEVEGLLVSSGYTVIRISGVNRYGTAVEIMKELTKTNQISKQAILTNGNDFADALAISSYAANNQMPILLTRTTQLPSLTKQALTDGGITRVLIVGGTGVVSEAVEDEISAMGIIVSRIQGSSRYSTSQAIASNYFEGAEEVVLASGMNFPDALAAAPYAARLKAPILLSRTGSLPDLIKSELSNGYYRHITALGGEAALSVSVKEVSEIIVMIANLPEISELSSKDQGFVDAILTLLEKLPVALHIEIPNLPDLHSAKEKIDSLLSDEEHANEVEHLIELLPLPENLIFDDKASVEAARAAYEALTDIQKSLVPNLPKLTAAETRMAEILLDKEAADIVFGLIDALPSTEEMTIEDKAQVQAARSAYDALTEAQKAFVTNLLELENAEEKILTIEADISTAEEVILLIDALPVLNDLTYADQPQVESARAAFDALTEAQKAFVTNLSKLTAAEARIAEILLDMEAADAVTNLIDALPSTEILTIAHKNQVDAARAAFDALTNAQKAFVPNLPKLTAAETRIAEILLDKQAADTVVALIAALPSQEYLVLDDEAQITAARAAYDALTTAQKGFVTNLDKLLESEAVLAVLKTDKLAADAVVALIDALPASTDLTLEHKTQVENARTAYNDLTVAQRNYVANYQQLLDAEGKILIMEQDKSAADAVTALINALPSADDVTLIDKEQIEAARAAYEDLTVSQKAYVSNLQKLQDAEAKIEKIESDMAEAAVVTLLISALPDVSELTLLAKPDVTAARTAYESLTADQKAYVSNYQKLLDVEIQLNILEATAADDADIASAAALLPSVFTAEEDQHENLLSLLNALPGMSDTGVTLSLQSSNANIASDGTITFTDDEVTGSVNVSIIKGLGTTLLKVIDVTVNAALPKAPIGTLLDADSFTLGKAVLYTREGKLYFKVQSDEGKWLEEIYISDSVTGKMDFDSTGNAHILYVKGTQLGYRFGRNADFSDEELLSSYNIGSSSGTLSKPDIAVEPDGTVHITYTDSHATSDDYSHPDIMYGTKISGGDFITKVVYRGYRDYSSSGSWGATYYNSGSQISVTDSGQYYIIAHKHTIWAWFADRDVSYFLEVYNGTESRSISNYNTNIYASYDLSGLGEKTVVLYKDTSMKSADLNFGGETLFTNVFDLGGQPASIATDGSRKFVSGVNSGKLQVYSDGIVQDFPEISVSGTYVGTIYRNSKFYSAFTDSSGEIQIFQH